MTPTPRADAAEILWNDAGLFVVPADFARQLERELAAEREQVAILRSDEKRLVAFAKTYRMNAEVLSDSLAAERALADRLAETLRFIDEECDWNEGGDYGSVTYGDNRIGPACDKALAAWKEARSDQPEIDRELDACVERSARDWRPLPGDPDELGAAERLQTETDDQAGDTA